MFLKNLLKKQDGISSVEFTLVAVIFLIFVFGIIDFSRVMYEWNAASKATAAGVRVAVVNNYVADNIRTFACPGAVTPGNPAPVGSFTPNPTICTNLGCGTNIDTNDAGSDLTFFTPVVNAMRQHYSSIQAQNVIIEFEHIGMGMCGNPVGPDLDPVVTVRLRDMQFDLFTPLISLIVSSIDMPDFAASLTGEDGRDTPPPAGGGGGP